MYSATVWSIILIIKLIYKVMHTNFCLVLTDLMLQI